MKVLLGILEKLKVLLAALIINLGGVRSLIELAQILNDLLRLEVLISAARLHQTRHDVAPGEHIDLLLEPHILYLAPLAVHLVLEGLLTAHNGLLENPSAEDLLELVA